MITLNLKLSVLFIECEVKGALINPLSWASLGNTNVYPIIFEVNLMISDLKKKIGKGSHRVKLSWGQGREPRTSLPPMASPPSRGTLSKLLSNATVKLLQKDWGEHYSRPSMVSPIPSKLQSHMQCSLEGYPHPITGMSPQMKIYHNCQKLSASYHNPGRSLKWKLKYVKK